MTISVTKIAAPTNDPIAIPTLAAVDMSFFTAMSSSLLFFALVPPGMLGGAVLSGRAATDWSDAVMEGVKMAVTVVAVGCTRSERVSVSLKVLPQTFTSSPYQHR